MSIAHHIEFIRAASPITQAVTKFGGQPVWRDAPQWPLSRSTGNPMRFVCQIALDGQLFPEAAGKMAYIFITDEDEYVDGTWEPDGGENAVIVQPGPAAPDVAVSARATGPTLYDMDEMSGHDRLVPVEREYGVGIALRGEPAFAAEEERSNWTDATFERYAAALEGNKIGGAPFFLQGDEFPGEGEWRLLLQLDSSRVPFSVNFGDAGIAYAFIDPSGRTAKLLWQCG